MTSSAQQAWALQMLIANRLEPQFDVETETALEFHSAHFHITVFRGRHQRTSACFELGYDELNAMSLDDLEAQAREICETMRSYVAAA